jgi:predicted RNA binding protein YcfA (HicA-like mRNA interferase family)
LDKDLAKLKGIKNVKFPDALKIAKKHFGEPRITGSHHIFKMPWKGDPMVNIQPDKNKMAKSYQVKALIKALKKLEDENEKKTRG